ncbi:MAG TPA: outer membrane protein assembly factor BamD [Burkholderiales bacterium]|nr:outer membrane protein assembly factor BamD [Burkholderiales bacterium]
MQRSLLGALRLAVVLLLAAAAGCASVGKEDETIGWSAQRLYGEAKDAMAAKDWPQAIRYFEKLEARYPYGRYAQQAQLEVAYAHWKDGERANAVAAIDRFIKLYPNHPNVDYAYYLKGLINFNELSGFLTWLTSPDMTDRDPKATREAFDAFQEVVTRFPDSRYAADAAARMRYLVNALASHEVHVARYYMKRGAFLAAANRAQYAVEHYPQSPAVEEAVFILVKAYDALGMEDLRDAADRVMRKNFPQSEYLKPGGPKRDVPWWRIWDPRW